MDKWVIYLMHGRVCMGPIAILRDNYVSWYKFYSSYCLRDAELFPYGSKNGADIRYVKILNKKQAIKLAFLYNKELLDECIKHREEYF